VSERVRTEVPGQRSPWRAFAMAVALVAAGCSSTDKPKPTPLENFTPTIAGRQVWSMRLSTVSFPLGVAVRNGKLFSASDDGTVVALQAESGAELWRASAGASLSAGVGSDGRFASVVTRDNDVVTLDGGKVLWRQRVPAKVVTPPLVAGERVFVMSVDRVVHAFDALDGRRLWRLQRPGDALTLAQAGVVTAAGNLLLVGQGARLTAVDSLKGTIVWDVPLATPRGSNEVERLSDLIGPATRTGDRVCARSFQVAIGCADVAKGSLLWSRNAGGLNAIGGDGERLFGADGSDRITAWRAASGDVAWTNEKLLYRGLSGALSAGTAVVFGDQEGQVHFLSATDGKLQLRLPTDGSAVIGTPVLSGTTIVVTTRNGGLYAFRPN
jgi:outer membrane protein assembly factor BamB